MYQYHSLYWGLCYIGCGNRTMENNMKHKEIVYLDTETTGLDCDYHEIISVCVIRKSDGRIWTWKAHPEWPDHIDDMAVAINGYTAQDWATALTQNEMAHELGMVLDGAVIVGHNPKFDLGFVENLFWRHKVNCKLSHRAIDTITLAYVYLVPWGLESLSLDEIRKFLRWPHHKIHTAIVDAQDVKKLYQYLTTWKRHILYIKLINWKLFSICKKIAHFFSKGLPKWKK